MTAVRTRSTRIVIVTALAMLMLAVPAVAQARVLEYQVQFLPAGTSGVSEMIVNVILAPETELPATVRVPLPAGATVLWSGEIVGDDPAADPYREATVTAVSGGQVVEFVMSESNVAQVEAAYVAPTRSGNDVSVALPWVNTGEEAPLLMSVRLEPGVSDVEISPEPTGDPLSNEEGETLYALPSLTLAQGGTVQIAVAYTLGGSARGEAGATTALLAVGGLLVVAVVALMFVAARDRRRRAAVISEEG